MNKSKIRKSLVFIFIGINLGLLSIPAKGTANSNYNVLLETGSQVLEVKYYNQSLWQEIISINSTPSDWFGGNSEIVGAQSKYTNIGKMVVDEISSTIFTRFFFEWYNIPYKDVLKDNGYDSNYINSQYPEEYEIIFTYNRYWEFRNQPFNDFPYYNQLESILFQNITHLNISLSNYNNFALVVNNDPIIQSLDVHLPILTSDELAWQYLIKSPVIPVMVSDYLVEMIDILKCENVTVENNKITFNKQGNDQYSGIIAFSESGRIESISIYDINGELIFKVVSFYPKYFLFIILGFSSVILIGFVVGYMIKRKKNREL